MKIDVGIYAVDYSSTQLILFPIYQLRHVYDHTSRLLIVIDCCGHNIKLPTG